MPQGIRRFFTFSLQVIKTSKKPPILGAGVFCQIKGSVLPTGTEPFVTYVRQASPHLRSDG